MHVALIRGSFVLSLLCWGSWAQAALVTYTLQNVVFDDGGTLSGTFTLDPTQIASREGPHDRRIEYDLKSTQGTSDIVPHEYTSTDPSSTWSYFVLLYEGTHSAILSISEQSVDLSRSYDLGIILNFAGDTVSDLIGTVPLSTNGQESNFIQGIIPIERSVAGGTAGGVVVSVPEAKSYAMILAGLVLIGAMSRKYRWPD